MSPVNIVWRGNCRGLEARARLLEYLQQLARLNESYLRPSERPHLTLVGEGQVPPRPNIELVNDVRQGEVQVSTGITSHPEILLARAREADLSVRTTEGSTSLVILDEVRLRGIDFRLFDPRSLYPENDRMSFVFIDSPEHHFIDGRLVKVTEEEGATLLSCPSLQLKSYLEDWTDCLFSWIRFFQMGDLWWRRYEELQGYSDYRGVFESVQTMRGGIEAEKATFDALISTFTQHAEYGRDEVQRTA